VKYVVPHGLSAVNPDAASNHTPLVGVARVEATLREIGSKHRPDSQDWQCPTHDDEHASLGVTEGKDGRVLIYCQAGCTPEHIVAALGLKMSDLFLPKGTIVATYPYVDEAGELLFEVVRESPKKFWQRAPDGTKSIRGIRRVLYRLPMVVEAVAAKQRFIWVPEGERDVESLEALGEVATTNSGGGGPGKWRPEYTASLVGAKGVIIVVDRDATGYAHGAEIAASLRESGVPYQLRAPVPEELKADLSDHLAAGYKLKDLVVLSDEDLARLLSGAKINGIDAGSWRWETGTDLTGPEAPMRWLVKGLWADGSHGAIAGEEKTLKSYIGATIAVAVAAGVAAFGRWEVPEPGPVLMLVGEGGIRPFRRRLRRIARAYGVDLADIPLYVTSAVAPLDSAEFREQLAAMLTAVRPRLVVLDPLYAYHPANVAASDLYARGPVLAALAALVTDSGAALMVVDHFNKSGSGTNLARISQAGMKEWVDSWVLVEHAGPPDVAGGRFRLGLTIGSRQWGGGEYALAYEVGAFNEDQGEHEGEIVWVVSTRDRIDRSTAGPREPIRTALADHDPFTLTRSLLYGLVKGNAEAFRATLAEMIARGEVLCEKRAAEENGVMVTRERLALNGDPYTRFRPTSTEEAVEVGRGRRSDE
jgi:AAA domain